MTVTVDEDILRIIRIAFNIFHTFPTFSDLLTGQAVAKVCSPVTYKDEAELPFALVEIEEKCDGSKRIGPEWMVKPCLKPAH